MTPLFKICPGPLDNPQGHSPLLNEDNFRMVNRPTGPDPHTRCREHEHANRPAEGRGLYLGVLLLADGTFMTKIGKTGSGAQGFLSRAGELAKDARKSRGLDVVWAEILYVIDAPHAENRTAIEEILKDKATPIAGTEYFSGTDFGAFEGFFIRHGRPYTKRRDHEQRNRQFQNWRRSA